MTRPRTPTTVVLIVLAATTAMHTLAANSLFIIPAIAPKIAADLGLSSALIGYQVSLVYLGAMIISVMAGSLAAMWGPIRTAQVGLFLGAAGLVFAIIPALPAFVVASLAIGAGYGLINPPSGHLLAKVSSPSNRSMLFSIKQTAVPIGGIIAGLIGPPLALIFGWEAALLASACLSLVMIALLQSLAGRFDGSRDRALRLQDSPFRDIALIWKAAVLRWITLSAFCFGAVQFTLTTYLVTLLVEDVKLGLVGAGIALSVFQLSAVFGRLAWGLLADLSRSGLAVLMAAYGLALATITPLIFMSAQWTLTAIYVCLAVLGASGAGWNGVFVSEIVQVTPQETAGRVIGGAFAFTFAGALLGPSAFALAYGWFGDYTQTASVIALFALAGCLFCVLAWNAKRAHVAVPVPTMHV